MDSLKKYIATTASSKHWENIGVYNHHGIVVPLFSLRSKKSSGIGEYLDLKLVIDWCQSVGFDVIQLLPLNETGIDPSPYNAISSCALNPIHITLHKLDNIASFDPLRKKLKDFEIFNSYQRVHYLQLKRLKEEFLYEYYKLTFDDIKKTKDFENFLINNPWLEEYGLYRALLNQQNEKNWDLWPDELQNINKKNIAKHIEKNYSDIQFYYFLQYLCYKELAEVKKYASEKNIKILGDIPILVSKYSSDVWFNKSTFNNNYIAGAPPDAYSIFGQKWGFPLFDWDNLKKTNYHWWKRRLQLISNFYHIYRIDHVVGFFRIWSILEKEQAIDGRFFPRDPTIWYKNGIERLTMMLESTPILPIGEDLGLIPKMVYRALKKLGICGTKVIPWEKNIFGYIKYQNYEPLSITTISTHDSDTFQQWWKGYKKGSTKFAKFKKWHYTEELHPSQRKEILYDSHHTSSIFHINLLQEYLALHPELVWPDPDDERINVPGTMSPTNWTYRFRPSFEEIMDHKKLSEDIKDILSLK